MMKKPNIIFILSDDLSYADIGCYGQKYIKTPNIDKIAQEGLTFNHAYAAAPICGPSRCGIVTGKHMGHAKIREHGQPVKGGEHQAILNPLEDITIGNVMQDAGYKTAVIGKWAVGLEGTNAIPNNMGFDYSFGFYDQIYAHTFYPEYLWENGEVYPLPGNYGFDMTRQYDRQKYKFDEENPLDNEYDANGDLIIHSVEDVKKAQNSYEECEKKALRFIRENKDDPFFLYYCVQNPHGPLIVPSLAPYTNADFPSLRHKEWASIVTRLDTGVGTIMDLLKELDIYEDTILVFASDNGYSAWGYFGMKMDEEVPFFDHKGPFKGGKFHLNGEAGIRVPFVVKWDGHIKPNTKTDQIIAFWDLLPTFAEMGQGAVPQETDGISFVPTLLGKEQKQHEYLYWENNHQQALRIGDYKVFRAHPEKETEVYDIVHDTFESDNIAYKHPDIVEMAKEIFITARTNSEIFINPGESKEEHLSRLDSMNLPINCYRADDIKRKEWLKFIE